VALPLIVPIAWSLYFGTCVCAWSRRRPEHTTLFQCEDLSLFLSKRVKSGRRYFSRAQWRWILSTRTMVKKRCGLALLFQAPVSSKPWTAFQQRIWLNFMALLSAQDWDSWQLTTLTSWCHRPTCRQSSAKSRLLSVVDVTSPRVDSRLWRGAHMQTVDC
jgi:hypothetical protein